LTRPQSTSACSADYKAPARRRVISRLPVTRHTPRPLRWKRICVIIFDVGVHPYFRSIRRHHDWDAG